MSKIKARNKEGLERYFRRLLFFALFSCFAWRMAMSGIKLDSAMVGVAQQWNYSKRMRYPSVTVCPINDELARCQLNDH
jgi:hypothetical protein